eukprot:TRINITY_DN163_c0_g1_i4.p1 TRINITY_DN163_c0_g1~~TRINITY_DN163_c0_g1_i4.p1  ORF type:complete len:305 (+),score=44.82 TRINITY_DN163_c0_g1_i4:106-915(+)
MYYTIVLSIFACLFLSSNADTCNIVVGQAQRETWESVNSEGITERYTLYDIIISNQGKETMESAYVYLRLSHSSAYVETEWYMNLVDGRDILVYAVDKVLSPGASFTDIGYIIVGGDAQVSINPTCVVEPDPTPSTTGGSSSSSSSDDIPIPSNNCQDKAILSTRVTYIDHAPYPYPRRNQLTVHNNNYHPDQDVETYGHMTHVAVTLTPTPGSYITYMTNLTLIHEPNVYAFTPQGGVDVALYKKATAEFIFVGEVAVAVVQAHCNEF